MRPRGHRETEERAIATVSSGLPEGIGVALSYVNPPENAPALEPQQHIRHLEDLVAPRRLGC